MKIQNIVTCIDQNKKYTEFVPLWSFAWKRITNANLIIGFIEENRDDDFVKKIKKYGQVITFPKMNQVDSGIQAKITRMIIAADERQKDTNCMIVDIDMIPLNEKVLEPFKGIPDDAQLVKWGGDHPSYAKGKPDFGKWPMDRTVVENAFFKRVINPKDLNYQQIIEQWFDYNITGRESVKLPFNVFSDESLLKALIHTYETKESIKIYDLPRMCLEKKMMSGRLDRANLTKWKKNTINEKLINKEIFEVHGVRPLIKNIGHYGPILEFFNLSEKDVIL